MARRTVIGIFQQAGQAERALEALRAAGFTANHVSVVAKDTDAVTPLTPATETGMEGAGTGAALGGLTGGVLGWLAGIGVLAIPGLGPIVAAGALALTLGGAALGAVTGGLIGALVDLGVPDEEALGYQATVEQGSLLLTVVTPDDTQAATALAILEQYGGADFCAYGAPDRVTNTRP
jgi:uncharacterized membrane protein